MSKQKVILAMSGGVDSSLAARLLLDQGYEVIGFTMNQLNEPGYMVTYVEDAKRLAGELGIEHHVIELKEDFDKCIISYFVDTYVAGETPNPCAYCNPKIKFGVFWDEAKKIAGNDALFATGHYVRTKKLDNGRYVLVKGVDQKKDQSYMLWALSQGQLSKFIAPLGSMTKQETRELAKKYDLSVAEKADSQDACFVDDNYHEVISKSGKKVKPGNFVDKDGNILGKHKGLPFYTIGQRKGLGVAAPHPWYVRKLNVENNTITLVTKDSLKQKEFYINSCNWLAFKDIPDSIHTRVKIRYNFKEVPCLIYKINDILMKIVFDEDQDAVTPGQSAVFYDGDILIGGGIITKEEV